MIDFSKLSNQKSFIGYIINRNNLLEAIIVGIIGSLAFPISSLISRVILHRTLPNEFVRFVTKDLLVAVIYFVASLFVTYFVCRIFKGKNALKQFTIGIGWVGIYSIILSLIILLLTISSIFLKPGAQPDIAIALPAIFCTLGMIIISFYAIKYEIIVIKTVFNFRTFKAIIIWIVTYIPLFIAYSENNKLTEAEKKLAGFETEANQSIPEPVNVSRDSIGE
ncbi:MAG: hypothetical protein GX639_07780 [Fibrobacter sp.]|nr:hypothetical protein [Fibrobacter sp.]